MSRIWPSQGQQGAQLMLMMLAARGDHEHQVVRLWPSPHTRTVHGMQQASTMHHEQQMAQPGTTRGAADAHDAGRDGPHHEHQVVWLRVTEK